MTIARVISATPNKEGSLDLTIELVLRTELAHTLSRAAESRKLRPIDLLSDIIEMVLKDDLIAAVLDK